MKLAVVVQRYGPTITGGAELHARYVAEHLARHFDVEVLTTCATDYVTWRNQLPAGTERINGVLVRRFPVRHPRDEAVFARASNHVFAEPHSLADELAWLEVEGPASRALVHHVGRTAGEIDFFLFFSYRYYHAYHGARMAPARAILVPTAERDPAIGLSVFLPIFRGVRAVMYNSPEERAMIEAVSGNQETPSVVVGIGSDVPGAPQPARFRQKFELRGPFAMYVGRIDENKGCRELFHAFEAYSRSGGNLSLVLVGQSLLPIPDNPRIRHLGFLNDPDKFDGLAASEVLIVPSRFESLSMVALEAWALARPVIANGDCDVLKGQCLRSNAGLYYHGVAEFVETLQTLERSRWLSVSLGRNGRRFFREQYDWPVIERKYLDMFDRLARDPRGRRLKPLPGWLARRAVRCPPAAAVMERLPRGPVPAAASATTRQPVRAAHVEAESGRRAGSRFGRGGPARPARSRRGGQG